MIRLGVAVKDRITGFAGVTTGRAEYITGCAQLLVAPTIDPSTGAFRESQWFDEQRLELQDPYAPPIALDNTETPGADRPAPKR